MAQDVDSPPNITILQHELEFLHDLVYRYFGSTISDTLALDSELNRRIGKAATTISSLTKRVWSDKKLTQNIIIQVYRAYVLSTLLYGSESLTTSAHCAGRTVIPELFFSATQGAVREQPIRTRHNSLSRLWDDANEVKRNRRSYWSANV